MWKQKTSWTSDYMRKLSKAYQTVLGTGETQVLWRDTTDLSRIMCVQHKCYEISIKSTKCTNLKFIQAPICSLSCKKAIHWQLIRTPDFQMGLVRRASRRQVGHRLHSAEAKGGKWLQGCPLAPSPDPPHARAPTPDLIPSDSLQHAPHRARSLSKCRLSVQLLMHWSPQNERKWEVSYSQFVAVFTGMSTTRMSVLYLHVLCQWIGWLISTSCTWHKVILNTRGLGEPVLPTTIILLMAVGLS